MGAIVSHHGYVRPMAFKDFKLGRLEMITVFIVLSRSALVRFYSPLISVHDVTNLARLRYLIGQTL